MLRQLLTWHLGCCELNFYISVYKTSETRTSGCCIILTDLKKKRSGKKNAHTNVSIKCLRLVHRHCKSLIRTHKTFLNSNSYTEYRLYVFYCWTTVDSQKFPRKQNLKYKKGYLGNV